MKESIEVGYTVIIVGIITLNLIAGVVVFFHHIQGGAVG